MSSLIPSPVSDSGAGEVFIFGTDSSVSAGTDPSSSFAVLAGGCFWCITPVLRGLPGVLSVTSGYSGGQEVNPGYEEVKHQKTGHREAVLVRYDASEIRFRELLEAYFASIDPYDGDGQFIDRGLSYSPAIFYRNGEERREAEAMIRELEAASAREVRVAVLPFSAFYPAEEYHQDYDLKNPEAFRRELEESGRAKAFGDIIQL